jgi:hypothetical protein
LVYSNILQHGEAAWVDDMNGLQLRSIVRGQGVKGQEVQGARGQG